MISRTEYKNALALVAEYVEQVEQAKVELECDIDRYPNLEALLQDYYALRNQDYDLTNAVEKERERCALIAEDWAEKMRREEIRKGQMGFVASYESGMRNSADLISRRIRNREQI